MDSLSAAMMNTNESTFYINQILQNIVEFVKNVFGDICSDQIMSILATAVQQNRENGDWREHLNTVIVQLQKLSERCSSSHPGSLIGADDSDHEQGTSKHTDLTGKNYISKQQSLVQITADEAEVRRRIAGFINSKQEDVNEGNVREFCFGLPDSDSQNSCARVDAVFVGHTDNSSRSRVQVKHIFNAYGPQTQTYTTSQWSHRRREADSDTLTLAALEERIANAEKHLSLGTETKANIFERLQALEERILFLEGLSPEYFQDTHIPPPKQHQIAAASPMKVFQSADTGDYESVLELDQKIYAMEQDLKEKIKAAKNREKLEMECV